MFPLPPSLSIFFFLSFSFLPSHYLSLILPHGSFPPLTFSLFCLAVLPLSSTTSVFPSLFSSSFVSSSKIVVTNTQGKHATRTHAAFCVRGLERPVDGVRPCSIRGPVDDGVDVADVEV